MPISSPQVRITIDGVTVQGATGIIIEQTGCYAASRFVVDLATGDTPLLNKEYYVQLDLAQITIELSNQLDGFVNILTGQVDNIKLNFKTGLVRLSGRDLAARLIDTEIIETFVNQTSSKIVETLAMRRGLVPNITQTFVPIGQYYELDHTQSVLGLHSHSGSEWDLIARLAQTENFNLTVVGNTLNFYPQQLNQPLQLNLLMCIDVLIDMAKTIPTSANVKSWNTRTKTSVSYSAGSSTRGTTTVIKPNLTSAQAQSFVDNHLSTLASHITILKAKMPGELDISTGTAIMLSDTTSSLDQIYMVDSIIREINTTNGFIQTLRAHAISA